MTGFDINGRGIPVTGRGADFGVADTFAGIITDFENDLSKFQGDTGQASIATSPVNNGTQSLKLTSGANNFDFLYDAETSVIYSTTLENLPARGWEFKYDYRWTSGDGGQTILFCIQDSQNFYVAYTNNNQNVRIGKVVNGAIAKNSSGAATSGSYDPDTWYTATIQIFDNGTITYNDSNGGTSEESITDSEWDGGGIGFGGSADGDNIGEDVYFDYARNTTTI